LHRLIRSKVVFNLYELAPYLNFVAFIIEQITSAGQMRTLKIFDLPNLKEKEIS